MRPKIVVIDDEKPIRDSVCGIFDDEGIDAVTADDAQSGIRAVRETIPDAVLLDIWMPGKDGMEALAILKEELPQIPVVMMSGHGTIETAVKATKIGAFDFIEKPLSAERLLLVTKNAINYHRLLSENSYLKERLDKDFSLIFKSSQMQNLIENVLNLSRADKPILLSGEESTGKSYIAKLSQQHSPRSDERIVEIDCANSDIIEPSAISEKIQTTRGGTVVLSEFQHLPHDSQRIVARESGSIRFILCSSANIPSLLENGTILRSFYQQLDAIILDVPPLRERKKDIRELVQYFAKNIGRNTGRQQKYTAQALEILEMYSWKGNIAELRNFVEQMLVTVRSEVVSHKDLPENIVFNVELAQIEERLFHHNLLVNGKRAFEKEFIRQKLLEASGNRKRAAEILGIREDRLTNKINLHQLNDYIK